MFHELMNLILRENEQRSVQTEVWCQMRDCLSMNGRAY